jgi:hypothetical protein
MSNKTVHDALKKKDFTPAAIDRTGRRVVVNGKSDKDVLASTAGRG